MKTHKLEGKTIRRYVAGAYHAYFKQIGKPTDGADFDYLVDDTCNKVHKYLTGSFATNGIWSDLQCSIALDLQYALGVSVGDNVEIYW